MRALLWNWVVVGAIVVLLLGAGINFVLSPYVFVADGFFIVATVLFLGKFVTWEEAHAQGGRGRVIVTGVLIAAVVLAVAVGGNHMLHPTHMVAHVSAPLSARDIAKEVWNAEPRWTMPAPINTVPVQRRKSKATARTRESEVSSIEPISQIQIANQKRVASADSMLPYGLEIVLTTTKDVSPTALLITFSGELGKMYGHPPGAIYTRAQGGILSVHKDMVLVQWETPAFSVEEPIVLTVYSRSYVTAKSVQSVPFEFPYPETLK